MPLTIDLDGLPIPVTFKKIKRLNLRVHPPDGRVTISAPLRMDADTISAFARSKLGWIRKQQAHFREQPPQSRCEYIDGESHLVWGRRYRLHVIERETAPRVELDHDHMILAVRPGAGYERKHAIVDDWYRRQLRDAAALLIARWAPVMGVPAPRVHIRRMKTRWGSCSPRRRSIRLNTELARRPPEFLEYIIVHELAHMLESNHGKRFVALMDRHLPDWRQRRLELNRSPLGHMRWD